MKSKPVAQRRKPPVRRTSDAERMTYLETAFEAAMDALPDKVGIAVAHAMKEVVEAVKAEVSPVADRLKKAEEHIQSLLEANARATGSLRVEQRVSGHLQDWMRTLTPYVIGGALWFYAQTMHLGTPQ